MPVMVLVELFTRLSRLW